MIDLTYGASKELWFYQEIAMGNLGTESNSV